MAVTFAQLANRSFIEHGFVEYAADSYGLAPSHWTNPPQKTWDEWRNVPCVVLLGEPGCGKSRELRYRYDETLADGHPAFFAELKHFHHNARIEDLVDGGSRSSFLTWRDHPIRAAYLFLDSIDEGRLKANDVLDGVISELRDSRLENLRLRLSCRIRDWRESLDRQALERLYPGPQPDDPSSRSVVALELLPLDLEAIRQLASEIIDPPDPFLDEARAKAVLTLAGHPLTLGLMLESFKRDQSLGKNRTEVFSAEIDHLLAEHNTTHKEMAQKTTSPLVRRQIAAKLAALSVLSNCDSLAVPDNDSPLAGFVDCTLASGDNSDTLETLQTALFRADSRGGFSFWHPALADFLGAEHVDKALGDGFHLNRLFPLVATPDGIPTRVRPLCAWLASINAGARCRIRALDPLVLLSGDVDQLSANEKEELIRALARRYAERDWQREITAFGELARGCDPALMRRMLAKRNSLAVRRMALDLIEQGRVEELYPDVWTVAADADESAGLRLGAVRLLLQRGMPAYTCKLRTLLSRGVDDGWNDEVAGSILVELYPAHLTTEDALAALRWPQDRNHIGRFHMFWAVEFENRVPDRDLCSVLARLSCVADCCGWPSNRG